jgi:hypothetical protein
LTQDALDAGPSGAGDVVSGEAETGRSRSENESSWQGAAAEHLVAATMALAGKGKINVAQTLWDADGIDLIFEGPIPPAQQMRVQVKSTKNRKRNGDLITSAGTNVSRTTFPDHPHVWLLFVVLDTDTLTFETSWLIPSAVFKQNAKIRGRNHLFSGSMKSKTAKWANYRIESRSALAAKVLATLGLPPTVAGS